MTAFDTMLDDLLADQNMALDAVYTPTGGAPAGVRVIRSAPDLSLGFGSAKGSPVRVDLRIVDAPHLAEGDALSIGSKSYLVAAFTADDLRIVWKVDLKDAP